MTKTDSRQSRNISPKLRKPSLKYSMQNSSALNNLTVSYTKFAKSRGSQIFLLLLLTVVEDISSQIIIQIIF